MRECVCATYIILGKKQSLNKFNRRCGNIFYTKDWTFIHLYETWSWELSSCHGGFPWTTNWDLETLTPCDLLGFFVLLWTFLYHSVFSPEISHLWMPQISCQWSRAFLCQARWRMEVAVVETRGGWRGREKSEGMQSQRRVCFLTGNASSLCLGWRQGASGEENSIVNEAGSQLLKERVENRPRVQVQCLMANRKSTASFPRLGGRS